MIVTTQDSTRKAEHPRQAEKEVTHSAAVEVPATTPFISHITPARRDVRYDGRTGHAQLPVEVCLRDGTRVAATLDMDPGQVQLLAIQLERGISLREQA